jgi:UDP-glucuronate 4-epimerase
MTFIGAIEAALGKTAEKEFFDIQPGDVPATYADIDDLTAAVGFRPQTSIQTGIERFVKWYRWYYRVGSGQRSYRPDDAPKTPDERSV